MKLLKSSVGKIKLNNKRYFRKPYSPAYRITWLVSYKSLKRFSGRGRAHYKIKCTVQCFIYHQLPSEFTAGITDYYKWHVILLIYTILVSFSDWGEKLLERNNTRAMFEAIWYFIGKRKNVSNLLVALNVSVQ